MSTCISTSSSDEKNNTDATSLETLLEKARPFIRGELEKVDDKLPSLMAVIRSAGAGECWHRQNNFRGHLFDVYRILKLWGAPDVVCLCGLLHSSYSNSNVNLALFDLFADRDKVRAYAGEAAERLIYLFCIVPRRPLVHDQLLFKYTESELMEHLEISEISLQNMKENGISNSEEKWRVKINSLVPADGVVVKHIRTGEDVRISRRMLAVFLLMTIADFSDQLTNFQDMLVRNCDGRRLFQEDTNLVLWPGDGKPGLWMNSMSRIGAVYTLMLREEDMMMEERKKSGHVGGKVEGRDEEIELVIPPVFKNCTKVLDAQQQIQARDLYWEAVCDHGKIGFDRAEELLLKSIEKNPFVGDPHVVLCQVYLSKGMFEEAELHAEKGLVLLLQWGSPWDKRVSWETWIAWVRVMLIKAKERSWPQTGLGVLNLGLVQ